MAVAKKVSHGGRKLGRHTKRMSKNEKRSFKKYRGQGRA